LDWICNQLNQLGFVIFGANPCICNPGICRPTCCQNPFRFNPPQPTSLPKFPWNPVFSLRLNSWPAELAWIHDLCIRIHAFAIQASVGWPFVKIHSHSTLHSQHHCQNSLRILFSGSD
jgi:hypothetical protein